MAGPLADLLFFLAVAAILVSHAFIVRSTLRGMRTGVIRGGRVREMVWAVLPAVVLVLLFAWTWRTMHPTAMRVVLPADHRTISGITT